jgi:hypothetical protein
MRDVFVLVWEREFNGNDARFQKQESDATVSDNPLHVILKFTVAESGSDLDGLNQQRAQIDA